LWPQSPGRWINVLLLSCSVAISTALEKPGTQPGTPPGVHETLTGKTAGLQPKTSTSSTPKPHVQFSSYHVHILFTGLIMQGLGEWTVCWE
jgi:hypothetical protein